MLRDMHTSIKFGLLMMMMMMTVMTTTSSRPDVVVDCGVVGGSNQSAGCLAGIEASSRLGLVGGWVSVDAPETNEGVKSVAAAAVERLNSADDDMKMYEVTATTSAYRQLVNGYNYCIKVNVKVTGCKPPLKGCNCAGTTYECEVSAYRPFQSANRHRSPTVSVSSVVCY